MRFLKKYWLLILIIALAIFLRFYKLNIYPALNADEASNGYDAYSLVQTGMDQHGHFWPITFQSFNDYKPGLYVYLVVPLVKFIGLNSWAVRIPGALFGTLTVLVLYLLVKELFDDGKTALVSALFLSISPWHIQFSRGGWEVNVATFFIVSGFLFFFKALHPEIHRSRTINFVTSSILLVASLYTYHSSRVVVPLLSFMVLVTYFKDIFKFIKPVAIFMSLSLILLVPLAIDLITPGALSRVAGVGLFADQGPINRIDEQRGEHGNFNSPFAKLVHNKGVNYTLAFLNNWASHFNGEFLFMSGDGIQRNQVPETGEMYLFDILFLAIGLIAIAKSENKSWKFIIAWLLIAPIASALTFQSPNALRSENMVIPITIISAFGFSTVLCWLGLTVKNKPIRFVFYGILTALISWNFARYLDMYWQYMSRVYPYSSQYGVEELVNYVSRNQSKYQNIFITNRYDQPYILFLFYEKYPPALFQFHHTLSARDDFGFSTVEEFGKYNFEPIDLSSISSLYPNSLIVGTPQEIPQTANIIKRVYGTNGFEYFDIVSN